jgi:hypothetical protein
MTQFSTSLALASASPAAAAAAAVVTVVGARRRRPGGAALRRAMAHALPLDRAAHVEEQEELTTAADDVMIEAIFLPLTL